MAALVKKMMVSLTSSNQHGLNDIGLLILRVSIGLLMAFAHGLGKIEKLMGPGPIQFPDPIGLGPKLSLILAGGAEFFLSFFLVLGLFTRLVSIPLAFTMIVAVFIFHADDPFSKMEYGILFLIPYVTLIFSGAGRFSIDHWINKVLKS